MWQSAAVITEPSLIVEIVENKTVFDAGETVTFRCIIYEPYKPHLVQWIFDNDLGSEVINGYKSSEYTLESTVDMQYPGDFALMETEENFKGQRVQVKWLKIYSKCSLTIFCGTCCQIFRNSLTVPFAWFSCCLRFCFFEA